jgi:ectoine hydroxylase-related dioxygenase (phytanoyl-CoA dioxygenase family)
MTASAKPAHPVAIGDTDGMQVALARDGFCIIPDVIDAGQVDLARSRLWAAVAALRQSGQATHSSFLDPNDANIRVYHLPEHDPLFLDLVTWPAAKAQVDALLGADAILSNFTANIARPGAEPMKVHSDMALVIPPPWQECWAMNVIWCLDDIREENGATRYLPGSHRLTQLSDIPEDCEHRMKPFEASAGSIIVMDGRLWHSSGANRTRSEDRALLFAYNTRPFIRQQVNWYEVLSPAVIASLDDERRHLFGFGALANHSGAHHVLLGAIP